MSSNALRVFISSAQSNEKELVWEGIREKIYDILDKDEMFEPFIMEKKASSMPSCDRFRFKASTADVIVMLIYGEVRTGTYEEYKIAVNQNKPLLIYFDKNEVKSIDAIKIKEEIETLDLCTYRYVNSFEKIDEIIIEELRSEIIDKFKYSTYNMSHPIDVDSNLKGDNKIKNEKKLELTENYNFEDLITRTELEKYNGSSVYLFDKLGLKYLLYNDKEQSEIKGQLYEVGISGINWILKGALFTEIDKNIFLEEMQKVYDDIEWLEKRWNAIISWQNGKYTSALGHEESALAIIKTKKISAWLEDDVLIDSRNLEYRVASDEGYFLTKSTYQKELEERSHIIRFPIVDRYRVIIEDDIIKDEMRVRRSSDCDQHFGSNLGHVLNNIMNYFYVSMIYGSYTHIILTRKILIDTLERYYVISGDSMLMHRCIELVIVEGDSTQFRKLITKYWAKIYPWISRNADSLFGLANETQSKNGYSIIYLIISNIGMYFTDEIVLQAIEYLRNNLESLYKNNSQSYLAAILSIQERMEETEVIDIIIDIVKNNKYSLGDNISNIIFKMNFDNVDNNKKQALCSILAENINDIIKLNGNISIIHHLKDMDNKFVSVEEALSEELLSVYKKTYDFHNDNYNWNDALKKELVNIQNRLEINKSKSHHSYFSSDTKQIINIIINKHFTQDMNLTIEEMFFPICSKYISNDCSTAAREECLICLSNILTYYKANNIKIPSDILDLVNQFDNSLCNEDSINDKYTKNTILYRILMLKILLNITNKTELVRFCFGLNMKNTTERIALIECVEQFLRVNKDVSAKEEPLIISMVIQSSDDENDQIRSRACRCMSLMCDTMYKEILVEKLNAMINDSAISVRYAMVEICESSDTVDIEIRKSIIKEMCGDSHYIVREKAIKIWHTIN